MTLSRALAVSAGGQALFGVMPAPSTAARIDELALWRALATSSDFAPGA